MLKLVRTAFGEKTSNFYAVIKYKGKSLGPDERIDADGCADMIFAIKTYKDLSSVTTHNTIMELEKKGVLNNPEFSKTKKNDKRHVVAIINALYRFMSEDAQYEFAKMYYHYGRLKEKFTQVLFEINEKTRTDLTPQELFRDLVEAISVDVKEVCEKTDIDKVLSDFIDEMQFPFPDLTGAGRETHHTKDMTFNFPEYYTLTKISLLCKLLFPIWGDLIEIVRQTRVVDGAVKELTVCELIYPVLLSPPYASVRDRLAHFIDTNVDKIIRDKYKGDVSKVSFIITHKANDIAQFNDTIFAMIIVKKLINYNVMSVDSGDLESKPSDIMKYIHVAISETLSTRLDTMTKKSSTLPRLEPPENHHNPDNATKLDHSAMVTKLSIAIPAMAECYVEYYSEAMVKRLGLSVRQFRGMYKFYTRHNPTPSIFNVGFVASLYADDLSGSSLISHLHYPQFLRCLVITQLYAVKKGYHLLAALLSCETPGAKPLTYLDPLAGYVKLGTRDNIWYQRCCEYFVGNIEEVAPVGMSDVRTVGRRPLRSSKVTIVSLLGKLVEWLVDFPHYVIVPPEMWDAMGVPEERRFIHQEQIPLDAGIMTDICRFILELHTGDTYKDDMIHEKGSLFMK